MVGPLSNNEKVDRLFPAHQDVEIMIITKIIHIINIIRPHLQIFPESEESGLFYH